VAAVVRHRLFSVSRIAVALAISALALAACANRSKPSGSVPESPAGATKALTVHTYLQEWSVRADPASAKAGSISFMAHNEGTMPHELVVVKTTLPVDKLPVGPDNSVVEGGPVEAILEIEPDELSPSMTATKTADLQAGSYVLFCNIPGHYSSGMRTGFTVTS
jgi:uncharacterized cupredoxin-like copper-binding protein